MLTVKEAADYLGKHPNTIRQWTKDYADFLSPSAVPTPGKERRFADDDMATLWTVAVLKGEGKHTADVVDNLATGLRIQPAKEPEEPKKATNGAKSSQEDAPLPDDATTIKNAASLALELVQGQVDSLTNERNYLRLELDTERQARLSAEVEAARAAGQLEAIYRRHWWQVWRPERPEEPND